MGGIQGWGEKSINYYLALRFVQHVGPTIYSTETSKCLMTVKEVSYSGGRTSFGRVDRWWGWGLMAKKRQT